MSFFTRTATHPTTPPASADPAIPGTITPNKPGEVLWLDGKQAEVLDIDDPPSSLMVALSTQQIACDAYVFTDRGVHLYYIKPNAPTEDIKSLSDSTHRRLADIEDKRRLGYRQAEDGHRLQAAPHLKRDSRAAQGRDDAQPEHRNQMQLNAPTEAQKEQR